MHRSNDWNCWGKQARTTPSPAGCEYDIAELQDCIAELRDGLVYPTLFSSEQAAHDLQHLIQNYDNTKTKKAVYGTPEDACAPPAPYAAAGALTSPASVALRTAARRLLRHDVAGGPAQDRPQHRGRLHL